MSLYSINNCGKHYLQLRREKISFLSKYYSGPLFDEITKSINSGQVDDISVDQNWIKVCFFDGSKIYLKRIKTKRCTLSFASLP